MKLYRDHSLRKHNTLGVDVKARFFAEAQTADDLLEALHLPGTFSQAPFILGDGSNVLFTGDYDGPVIKVALRGIRLADEDSDHVFVQVAAGENWHALVESCLNRNWAGIENLSLIPGSVGAAPVQNIGAYGVELDQVFHSLEGIERSSGMHCTLSADECRFSYRNSIFKQELKDRFVITSVTLRLFKKARLHVSYGALADELAAIPSAQRTIRDVSEAVCRIRRSKLPDPAQLGNAGSFFKNPVIGRERFEEIRQRYPNAPGYDVSETTVKMPAAWLIEQCGWKGKRIGDAGVYDRQALVLVNHGNATGRDIIGLAREIRASVLVAFEIELTPEVNIV